MSKNLGTLTVDIAANASKFVKGMDKAARATHKRAQQIQKNINKYIKEPFRDIQKISKIAITATVGSLAYLTKKGFDTASSQQRLAAALESTYDSITALNKAFSDSGIDGFESSLNRLNRRLGAAELGRGAAAKAVKELNLNLTELGKANADEKIALIADAIKETATSSQMAARFAQDLGFEQAEAAKFFLQGGDAIREYAQTVEELGLKLDDVDATAIERARQEMGIFGDVTKTVGENIAGALAPSLTYATEKFEEYIRGAGGAQKATKEFTEGLDRFIAIILEMFDVAVTGIELLVLGVQRSYLGLREVLLNSIQVFMSTVEQSINFTIKQLNRIPAVDISLFSSETLENTKSLLAEVEREIDISSRRIKATWERESNVGRDYLKRTKEIRQENLKSSEEVVKKQVNNNKKINKSLADSEESYLSLLSVHDREAQAAFVLEKELRKIDDALSAGNISTAEHTQLLKLSAEAYKDTIYALREQNETIRENKNEWVSLLAQYDEHAALADSFIQQQERIEKSFEEGNISLKERSYLLEESQKQYLGLLERLDEQEESEGYWEKWLEGANNALNNFDELGKTVVDNFSSSFAGAFESLAMGTQSLGDAFRDMAQGMLSAITRAIGEMIAQWVAYQAVQMVLGKSAQASAGAAIAGEAMAGVNLAGINAFSSTAAIPMVGPAMAPAAMAAAIAATTPLATAASTAALAGMAHDGIDSVPREGTWLLDKGERVLTADTSKKLDSTLDRVTNNSSNITQVINVTGEVNNRTASQMALETDRRLKKTYGRLG